MSLVGRGPDGGIGGIAAGEIAVTIGLAAGRRPAIPDGRAAGQSSPGDFGDRIGGNMPRTGDSSRDFVAFTAGKGIGDISGFHMGGMGADRQLIGRYLAMKPLGGRARLIVNSTVAMSADDGIRTMAIGTDGRVPRQRINDAVDMQASSDNLKGRVHNSGMTRCAGKVGIGDMETMFP